jgi:hypothetical protein
MLLVAYNAKDKNSMAINFKDGVILGGLAMILWEVLADVLLDRCGQQNHNRCIYCESCHGQAYTSTRYHMVLQIWVCCRYTGCCGYCPLSTGDVRYSEWPPADNPSCRCDVPRVML